MGLLLLIFLLLAAIAAIPTWPYSKSWTIFPSLTAGLVALLTLALLLLGILA
jgi:hypothetical protein